MVEDLNKSENINIHINQINIRKSNYHLNEKGLHCVCFKLQVTNLMRISHMLKMFLTPKLDLNNQCFHFILQQ